MLLESRIATTKQIFMMSRERTQMTTIDVKPLTIGSTERPDLLEAKNRREKNVFIALMLGSVLLLLGTGAGIFVGGYSLARGELERFEVPLELGPGCEAPLLLCAEILEGLLVAYATNLSQLVLRSM